MDIAKWTGPRKSYGNSRDTVERDGIIDLWGQFLAKSSWARKLSLAINIHKQDTLHTI